MATGTQKAIFLGPDGEVSIKEVSQDYKPTGNQALVKVKYSAINPADLRHSYMGLHGSVAGYEWVGTAIEVGDSSPFTVGQDLFGMVEVAANKPQYLGAHQNLLVADGTQHTWALPKGLSPEVAVGMPVAVQTVADALFNAFGFGFPEANISGSDAANTAILIWGGASSVGAAAIQIANTVGFNPIFTTASKHNHASLEKLGAMQCFDYRSPEVVQEIKAAVAKSGKKLRVVFDAVSANIPVLGTVVPEGAISTAELGRQSCSEDVPEKDLLLCGVLPVPTDPTWKFCLGVRNYGDKLEALGGMAQDPEFPVRMNKFIVWLVANHEKHWQQALRITKVKGAEEGVRQIRRVFGGGASMEKVLIERPL
ncbi:hypothetical protein V2G26_012396 [Clonostachys chloroleuca]